MMCVRVCYSPIDIVLQLGSTLSNLHVSYGGFWRRGGWWKNVREQPAFGGNRVKCMHVFDFAFMRGTHVCVYHVHPTHATHMCAYIVLGLWGFIAYSSRNTSEGRDQLKYTPEGMTKSTVHLRV